MEEQKDDQVVDGITDEKVVEVVENENTTEETKEGEGDEQFTNNQEKTDKEPATLDSVVALIKGLQKGYTVNAQAISDIKGNLQPFVDKFNEQTESQSGDDEYMTVGKMKELFQEQAKQQSLVQQKSDAYIANTLAQLRASGIISDKKEEDALIQYAVDKKEPDLLKAADRWQEIKQAKADAKKEAAKTSTQQDAGSKVGTSSKTSTNEQGGVDYNKVRLTDFNDF